MVGEPAASQGRRYRLIEVLGEGGFGTVYRAELRTTGGFSKEVALKVLHEGGGDTEEFVRRLRDEARVLGLLRHRAVVGIDGLARIRLPGQGEARGWAVVTEYIHGLDAGSLVEGDRVPIPVAVEIVEEVASALEAAWDRPSTITGRPLRLVHRDIRPANIRITDQGQVKVLDFGASRADFGTRESRTSDMIFGTMRYMAPERTEADDRAESDVFSLGVVLLELLAGGGFDNLPLHPTRVNDAVASIMEGIRDRFPDASTFDEAASLVQRMVAFEFQERPGAAEVVAACRDLRRRLPGPDLRAWAEEALPERIAEAVAQRAAGIGAPPGSSWGQRSWAPAWWGWLGWRPSPC